MRRALNEQPRQPAHPLAAICTRTRGVPPGVRFAPPRGDGWHRLGSVDAETVGAWVHEIAAARLCCPQGRYVAGAFLGAQLARGVLLVPTLSLATERRAPDVALTNLAVRR
ncbi:MAG: hypothetical protein ACRDKW_17500, partial [Actinomycetota bacterium]